MPQSADTQHFALLIVVIIKQTETQFEKYVLSVQAAVHKFASSPKVQECK